MADFLGEPRIGLDRFFREFLKKTIAQLCECVVCKQVVLLLWVVLHVEESTVVCAIAIGKAVALIA